MAGPAGDPARAGPEAGPGSSQPLQRVRWGRHRLQRLLPLVRPRGDSSARRSVPHPQSAPHIWRLTPPPPHKPPEPAPHPMPGTHTPRLVPPAHRRGTAPEAGADVVWAKVRGSVPEGPWRGRRSWSRAHVPPPPVPCLGLRDRAQLVKGRYAGSCLPLVFKGDFHSGL